MIKSRKNFYRVTQGYRSKWQGEAAEIFFERECISQNILTYKIHDPNYKTKKLKSCLLDKSQLCDYILILSDGLPFFVDVKSQEKKIIRSTFYPSGGIKKTPTQKQFMKFLKIYGKGFIRTGFIFKPVKFDNEDMFFISTHTIREAQKTQDFKLHKFTDINQLPGLI